MTTVDRIFAIAQIIAGIFAAAMLFRWGRKVQPEQKYYEDEAERRVRQLRSTTSPEDKKL